MEEWNNDGEKKRKRQKYVKYKYVWCVKNWGVKCDWWGVGCENSNKMNEVVCKKRKIMKKKS
jgi:hypothetical protein